VTLRGQTSSVLAARRPPLLSCTNAVPGRVELRGLEPLTPCMPSQSHRQTGPYGASPDATSHQVGRQVKALAVRFYVGLHGPVADTLLTTHRKQNAGSWHRAVTASMTSSLSVIAGSPLRHPAFLQLACSGNHLEVSRSRPPSRSGPLEGDRGEAEDAAPRRRSGAVSARGDHPRRDDQRGVFSELAHLRGCVGCWTSAYRLRGPPPIRAPHAFSPTLGRLTRRDRSDLLHEGEGSGLRPVLGEPRHWAVPTATQPRPKRGPAPPGVNFNHTGPGAIPPRDWHVKQVGQQQQRALVTQRDRQRRPPPTGAALRRARRRDRGGQRCTCGQVHPRKWRRSIKPQQQAGQHHSGAVVGGACRSAWRPRATAGACEAALHHIASSVV
jgi:hypothetical protein